MSSVPLPIYFDVSLGTLDPLTFFDAVNNSYKNYGLWNKWLFKFVIHLFIGSY